MSKSLRLPEKWFRLGLWLVAFAFAWFLIGLGGLVVGNLPQIDQRQQQIEDFIPSEAVQHVQAQLSAARNVERSANKLQETARLKHEAESARYQSARDTFNNWVSTRRATERPEQDAELINRTQALDKLKEAENTAREALEEQERLSLEANQAVSAIEAEWEELREEAHPQWLAAMRAAELHVFLVRLAITLPLLVAAGWLFAKKRKSTWWPFVWGFIFFALFAFFVELVPYLPDYGGYVRYIVGIVVTILLGRYAIVALNRYLERQKAQESLPEIQRRNELSYDVALGRLSKGVCPGCERSVDLKNGEINYCPSCGIGLFNLCSSCGTRKSSFSRYCHACGTPDQQQNPTSRIGDAESESSTSAQSLHEPPRSGS